MLKKIFNSKGTVEKVLDTGSDIVKTLSAKEQGTKRMQLDMMADTVLSKNIRPIVALWSILLLTVYLILDGFGIKLNKEIGETIFWLIMIVMTFYFPSRTVEKWIKSKM